MAARTIWTPSQEKKAVDLCRLGLTMEEIARHFGVTKNAVVSKLHRLGESKLDQIRKNKKEIGAFDLIGLGLNMCCWPHGDKEEGFYFCGRETVSPKKPYCQEHAERAYSKSKWKPTVPPR